MLYLTSMLHKFRPLPCRKVFGDNPMDPPAGRPKMLQITTKTSYKLMKQQWRQGTDGGDEQEGEVFIEK